jgi:NitT/TauT family transport system substrate-binding protein
MPRVPLRATISALAIAAAACGRGAPERLVVGVPRQPSAGLLYVALAEGLFEENGVRVEERAFAAGRDALGALLRGDVDVAVVYTTPVLRAAPRAPNLEVLTTLHASAHNTRLVARRERGITTAADLAGKRVGLPRGTNAELFLETLLSFEGIAAERVEIVDLPPERCVDALGAGEVDAVAVWSPHVDRAVGALGPNGATQLSSDVYTEVSLVATRADVRLQRRRAIVGLLRGLAAAEARALADPDATLRIVAETSPGANAETVREQWARIDPGVGLSHLLATVLRREDEWLRRSGAVAGPPLDLGRLLQPGPLEEVAFEAVTFTPARGAAP